MRKITERTAQVLTELERRANASGASFEIRPCPTMPWDRRVVTNLQMRQGLGLEHARKRIASALDSESERVYQVCPDGSLITL